MAINQIENNNMWHCRSIYLEDSLKQLWSKQKFVLKNNNDVSFAILLEPQF